jgi:hypothetical protein
VITPRWRAFVDAILRSSAHIVCTGRSKTETAQVEDHGKKKVAKLGMKLEARDGLEYEFTTVLDLVHDGHYATVSKDRTGIFSGDPKPITVETGKRLAEWLAGAEPAEDTKPRPAQPPKATATKPTLASGAELVEIVRSRIAAASTVAALGKVVDGIDNALSQGRLSDGDWSDLTDLANARHEEIEPTTQETVTNG